GLLRVLDRVANDDAATLERPLDLRLVAADLLAPAAKHLVLLSDALDAAARVPRVGVLRDGVERLPLARAADQDRQALLEGRRIVPDALRAVEAATGARLLLVEHPMHQLDRLVEPVEPLARALAERDPEGRVLGLEPRAADAEVGAAARNVVER